MTIGSNRPTKNDEPKKWGCIDKIGLAAVLFLVGVPLLGWVALKVNRSFETPQERALEDQEDAQRDQAAKAEQEAKELESSKEAWADVQRIHVKANVLASLKDPDSAVFGSVFVRDPEKFDPKPDAIVCGSVNAKNSFGGYTGMQHFVAYKNSLYFEPDSAFYPYWNSYCAKGQFL